MSSLNEFELINHFFKQQARYRPDVILGIGDDAALLQIPEGQLLAVTTDTLIAGVHFPENSKPFDIAYKALAVNLSDLAAMGAEPAWISLALTLPEADQVWLEEFCNGLFTLIKKFNLQLIGGDTTRGHLSITITAQGFVPANNALRRSGAKPGDKIYVTGTLGDAGLALQLIKNNATYSACEKILTEKEKQFIFQRFNRPEPKVEAGLVLRNIASSAIDISDGLAADLNHILQASNVGATIIVDNLPLSSVLKKINFNDALTLALSAGDDYELCFTISPEKEQLLKSAFEKLNVFHTFIGIIEKNTELRLHDRHGQSFVLDKQGFKHF